MTTLAEFLAEIDGVFGFYYDVRFACHQAREAVRKIQAQHNLSDASNLMFGRGAPAGTPAQELEHSLHATSLSAWKLRLQDDGYDNQRAAAAAVVFVFHIWDEKYRGKLSDYPQTDSDIMGDLRLLRNSIIHNKGIAGPDVARCKVIKVFSPGAPIELTDAVVAQIITAIRAEFRKTGDPTGLG